MCCFTLLMVAVVVGGRECGRSVQGPPLRRMTPAARGGQWGQVEPDPPSSTTDRLQRRTLLELYLGVDSGGEAAFFKKRNSDSWDRSPAATRRQRDLHLLFYHSLHQPGGGGRGVWTPGSSVSPPAGPGFQSARPNTKRNFKLRLNPPPVLPPARFRCWLQTRPPRSEGPRRWTRQTLMF